MLKGKEGCLACLNEIQSKLLSPTLPKNTLETEEQSLLNEQWQKWWCHYDKGTVEEITHNRDNEDHWGIWRLVSSNRRTTLHPSQWLFSSEGHVVEHNKKKKLHHIPNHIIIQRR